MGLELFSDTNRLTKQIVFVIIALVALIFFVQLVRSITRERAEPTAEFEAIRYYGESIHGTISYQTELGEVFPLGDCMSGYRLGDVSLTPTRELLDHTRSCEVQRDNTGRPVVVLEHRDGTRISVP